ncbi:MAG: ABC transporter ATP-binding protein/permease [Erysipelotrichaceae bacterium]|nr:ABC transporter ATP-binding protein/permease [Erysipelotrichaceae bacterium]
MKNKNIWNYILKEKKYLFLITITGLIYNVGLLAGPYFEGQLAGCLVDISKNLKTANSMIQLSVIYICVILFVQFARFLKRYFVREFGNDINRNLKMDVYKHFVYDTSNNENAGSIMTKAISDADACSEGIRKFTTEIFDTGIALISYIMMLVLYDAKLTCFVIIFPVISYLIANKLGPVVAKNASNAKKSAERLNTSTLDRLHLAITYRIYGEESNMHEVYEKDLQDYEDKTVRSNILETALKPLYEIISMTGIVFIIYFGSKRVMNNLWDVAIFTTYISCFTKMAVKSSKAAKLFNTVQKAKVSWDRIYPIIENDHEVKNRKPIDVNTIEVSNLSYAYDDRIIFSNVSFQAKKGDIIGITGEIASGKSTLGKVFLENSHYQGKILVNKKQLKDIEKDYAVTSYMGHNLELFDDTIENNIKFGKEGNILPVLDIASMKEEIETFPDGIYTRLGEGGIKLSGGQQSRIALVRTLYHARGIIVLDDPFSACDKNTEKEIYENIRREYKDSIIFLISHRLSLFDQMNQILFIDNQSVEAGTHQELLKNNEKYKHLYFLQTKEFL